MSSWDNNRWTNFCDAKWKLICRNKWHPRTSEISTPLEVAVGAHFHVRHGTTNTRVFLPIGCYFQLRSPYSEVAQCNQKTTIPTSSRRPVTFEKAKEEWASRLIIATTSIQPPKSVSTDLTLKSDSILTSPIGKSCGARLIDAIKDLSLKVFLLWHHH